MNTNADHDEMLDKALRQGLRSGGDLPTGSVECPDAETVAAWTEGGLSQSEAALIETHLAACARCQTVLGSFARSFPPGAPAESVWQRWRLRWVVPIAAAATAASIWIALPNDQRTAVLEQDNRAPASAPSGKAAPAAADSATPAPAAPLAKADQPRAPAASSAEQERRLAETDALKEEAPKPQQANDAVRSSTPGSGRLPVPTEPQRADADTLKTAPAADARARQEAAAASPPSSALSDRVAGFSSSNAPPVEIISPDATVRWRIVNGIRVERSTTGGKSWDTVSLDVPGRLIAGSSPSPLVCWIVGQAGVIRLTVDGVRFEPIPPPSQADFVAVRAMSATGATVTAGDGRQFRTEDQGQTWASVP